MEIKLTPIGFVKNALVETTRIDCGEITSEIIIKEEFKEALGGIDEFSHIVVIYWLHKTPSSQRSVTKVHPKHNQNLPLIGVFATRSPVRPNPIGISTVKLLKYHANVLEVIGLDAVNGTPVLDIKPHIPGSDSPTEVRIPDWLSK
jgi:tRNA-Thr(GGU) m(6)t(6)A37 methyltransferase TsaA